MESFRDDEVTRRAVEAMNSGQAGGRPLFEAADRLVRDEEVLRREFLNARAEGYGGPLDPNLFPPDVFDGQGNRLTYNDGKPRLTDAEARRAFEWEDSRW